MTFFVVASKVCGASAAAFGALAAVLVFLEVHLGDDKAVARDKLNRLYDILHENPVARLPRVLFEVLARFHSPAPRHGSRFGLLAHSWWLALIMIVLADAVLAAWYPHDVLEFYRDTRRSVLEEVPVTLYNDDVTFGVGLIGILVLFVIFGRAMGAVQKMGARSPLAERPTIADEFSLDWRRILIELIVVTCGAVLIMLLAFGIGVVARRFEELPAALGVVVSILSFPFLFVLFFYLAVLGLVLLEQTLKLILLCLFWVKAIRRWFARHLEPDYLILGWLFERFEYCVLFVLGISLSMALTFLALALGHALHPDLPVPQTWQLFAANALGDGLTLSLTFVLVRWAVAPGKVMGRIPVAILLDIGATAVLACLALYAGLWGAARAISPGGVVNVLFGNAPGGAGPQFGPYFWVMHTTFLPVALFLLVLTVLWLVKCALDPAAWILRQAAVRETPLKYLVAAAGMCAAVFSAFGAAFALIG